MAPTIDVHHHILPTHYVETVGSHPIAVQGSSGRVPHWGVENALEGMDGAGIQTAITSVSAPGLTTLSPRPASALARWCNEFAASLGRIHPKRFGMFACLPMHEIDACLHELTYAYNKLDADGVCLLSNYAGLYLGDEFFSPLYEELNRREAVVFVHPTSPQHLVQINQLSASTLEFPFDTARTMASLIFGGVIRKYPSIRWIFSHAGGALPYLCGRIEVLTTNNPSLREQIPNGFQAELKKLYFDTALSGNSSSLNMLADLVSPDRILLGTDYPFGPKGQMAQTTHSIEMLDWSIGDKANLRGANANCLFPRFA